MNLGSLFENPAMFLLELLYILPAILIGLSFHEAAHAYTAYRMGDPTAKNLGRVTLDPGKHLDPIGFLCLLLVGFGWAKPVPVNPNNFKDRRKGEFVVSIAGVAMNGILAVIFTLVFAFLFAFKLNDYAGIRIAENMISISVASSVSSWLTPVIMIIQNIISINIVLMIFNFLPIGPLDGMGIYKAVFWKSSYKFEDFMARYGTIILLVLLISGVIGYVVGSFANVIQVNLYRLIFSIFGIRI